MLIKGVKIELFQIKIFPIKLFAAFAITTPYRLNQLTNSCGTSLNAAVAYVT